jgi:H/ACA ribonucleoprotein complex subunit 2
VIASDITPLDVISHLPVYCEENSIPYYFITSKLELGRASRTKRPTSCVLIDVLQKSDNKKSGQFAANKDEAEIKKENSKHAKILKKWKVVLKKLKKVQNFEV